VKKIVLLAIVAVGIWLAWRRVAPSLAKPAASTPGAAPAASAQQRIDALSGAAPSE
jgi:hypothetical protein